MDYDPEKHHRRSIRLKGYDYTKPAGYFLTVCTKNHQCLFGEISGYKMYANNFGNIIINCWEWLSNQYSYIEIDEFVLMPNHIHGIIFIDNEPCRGDSRIAPTHSNKPKTLGRIVGAFKTVSTKKINQIRKSPGKMLWQRNYYEHIIRNNKSLDQIRQYIINNPLKWDLDRENPKNWNNLK